jgi:hypothetical protein
MTILAQTAIDHSYDLSAGGWLTMILSVGFVVILTGWCVRRVMRESTPTKLHSQIDFEPGERQ